ncbi:PDCD5-related protein [Amanita muscaria]
MENVNLSQIQPGAGVQNESDQDAKRLEQEQVRRDLVASILDSAARERLSRIALVSPERSAKIEGLILSLAQAGKIQRGQRVSENQLIDLLEQLEERGKSTNKKATVVFQRRKDIDDDLDF